MADQELTKLIFEFEEQGAAQLEKNLRAVEKGIGGALNKMADLSLSTEQAEEALSASAQGMAAAMSHVENKLVDTGKEFGSMFSSRAMREQENNIKKIRAEMESLGQIVAVGTEEQKKAARERLQDLEQIAKKEMAVTTRVFQQHQEEFERLVNAEKKALADLAQEAAGGGVNIIQAFRQRDVGGITESAQGGIRNLGQQAQRRAFDIQMRGGPQSRMGGVALQALTKFAKVAGPLAAAAGAIGLIVKLFLDLDAKVKETNRALLENVSLAEMAASNYSKFKDSVADAEVSMEEFRDTVMTDMDLRMLGLDPAEMGQVLSALNEQGMLLKDLRQQGVSYGDALEKAQIAALNLGMGASEAAELIGTLVDVTGKSFDEAMDSMTMVIDFAQESSISTKRFYGVVSNITSQMGLYNYKIEETAALMSKLTEVMDAQSAEEFTNELATSIKDMTAMERTTMVVVNGLGTVVEMAKSTQKQLEKTLDPEKIGAAFSNLGLGDMFDPKNLEGSIEKLTKKQRNMLDSQLDEGTRQIFKKYRRFLETDMGNEMEVQARLSDLQLGQQVALQIGHLEKMLKMPLDQMNSVLAETQGVSESQLRMMQSLKQTMSGDLDRLRKASETGDEEAFNKLAEEMGYSVELQEIQEGQISTFTDLMNTMTEKKQKELNDTVKDQKTLAEKSAELQRDMLDTIKYKLLDLVSNIYRSILDIYDAIMNLPGMGGTDSDTKYQRKVAERASALRKEERRVSRMEPGEAKAAAEAALRKRKARYKVYESSVANTEGLSSVNIAGRSQPLRREEALKNMERLGVTTVTDLQREMGKEIAGKKAARELVVKDLKARNTGLYTSNGKLRILTPEEVADYQAKGKPIKKFGGPVQSTMKKYVKKKGERLFQAQEAMRKDASEELAERMKDGNLTNEEIKKLQNQQLDILDNRGIRLADDTAKGLAKKIVDEQIRASILKEMAAAGIGGQKAGDLLGLMMGRNKSDLDTYIKKEFTGEQRTAAEAISKKYVPPTAHDARIITKGVPFLNLQPGDIVVDQGSLARTIAGGKGDFVPDLLRNINAKASGVGTGRVDGRKTLNANFFITGGNTGEIRTTILKVLQEWERHRSMA